jgi:hypothetical protein
VAGHRSEGRRRRSTASEAATLEERKKRWPSHSPAPPRHGAPPPLRSEVPHYRPSALREKRGKGEGGGGGGRGGAGPGGRAAEVLPAQGPCGVAAAACGCLRMEWEAARDGIGSWGVAGWVVDFICWAGWAEWAPGPRASTWAASCWVFSCRVGPTLWAEIVAQHSPMSCSCRPRPEIIVLGSCSCRTKNSCFGPAHGPRAIWQSISAAMTAPRHLETHKIRILLDRLHLPGTIPWLHLDIRCLPMTPCNGGQ